MGKQLSLLSCIAYTFGMLNAVVIVKSRLKRWLDTGDGLIKPLVASDGSDSAAAQGLLSCLLCLDSEICGELLLFTYSKSIIHFFCWHSFLLS